MFSRALTSIVARSIRAGCSPRGFLLLCEPTCTFCTHTLHAHTGANMDTLATTTPMQRAFGIITAFCASIDYDEGDDIDPESGEVLFDILYDLHHAIQVARTESEQDLAETAFAETIIAMASITNSLLNQMSLVKQMDKFDLIPGMAQELYGSVA